jgi:hypothetical protein
VTATQGQWFGGGAATIHAVDADRQAWIPVQIVEHDDDLPQPNQMSMYMTKLDLPQLLGESHPTRILSLAGTKERPRVNMRPWSATIDIAHGSGTAATSFGRLIEDGSHRLTEDGDDRLLEV